MLFRALVPLLVALALAAGCGGDSESEAEGGETASFEQLVQRADAQVQELSGGEPESAQEFAERAQGVAQELEEIAGQLESMQPPEDAPEQTGRLVQELRTLSNELQRAVPPEGAETGPALGDPELQRQSQEAVSRVQEAITQLEQLGYDVRSSQ